MEAQAIDKLYEAGLIEERPGKNRKGEYYTDMQYLLGKPLHTYHKSRIIELANKLK